MKIMSIVGCLCFRGQELGTLNTSISKDYIIPWSKLQVYTVWYAWMCLSKHDTDYLIYFTWKLCTLSCNSAWNVWYMYTGMIQLLWVQLFYFFFY